MSTQQWYYATTDHQRQGPVSAAQLGDAYRAGQITPDSLVWTPGLHGWQPLREFAAQLHIVGRANGGAAALTGYAAVSPCCAISTSAKEQTYVGVVVRCVLCGFIFPFNFQECLSLHQY